jgi:hypothetical protein
LPNKNVLVKTGWLKGHASITGNKLADMAANPTSSALQLGIISQTHFQTAVTDTIDATLIYMYKNNVNCDFVKPY